MKEYLDSGIFALITGIIAIILGWGSGLVTSIYRNRNKIDKLCESVKRLEEASEERNGKIDQLLRESAAASARLDNMDTQMSEMRKDIREIHHRG